MITLLPYNPLWPKKFDDEKNRLLEVLGSSVCIEHIGSTAIPGIYAKPVIDILIGVPDLALFSSDDIKKIESLDYQYRQDFEKVFPYRRFFQKDDTAGNRIYQIHLANYSSAWWERHILFRDYLRQFPEEAKQYETLKLALAQKMDDTNQYAMAKTEYCESVNKKAYFYFQVHAPKVQTERLNGYIPQLSCFEIFKEMFSNPEFVNCFGVSLSDEQIKNILIRNTNYWDQYGFGPYVWFDKQTQTFVGQGGLNHNQVEMQPEIELVYSVALEHWGKGFASEIGQYAINDAFTRLQLNHLVCFTLLTNKRSLKVMEKLGFVYQHDFIHFNLPHKLYLLTRNS